MHNQPPQRSRQPGCPPPRGFFNPTPSSPEPFADLYDRLSRSIHGYFARRVDDDDTAFDLAAETFAKAFEKRFDFRGSTKAQAESWIWGIAHAVLGTYGRTRRVEFEALDRIGLAPEEDPDAPLRLSSPRTLWLVRERRFVTLSLSSRRTRQRSSVSVFSRNFPTPTSLPASACPTPWFGLVPPAASAGSR